MSVTVQDKQISLSRWQKAAFRIQILNDDGTILDELQSLADMGSITTDSSGYSRRTYSFTMSFPEKGINFSEKSKLWMHRDVKVQVGLKTPRMNDYHWYDCGVFIFTDISTTYDQTTRSLTANCSDKMALLDGTVNGELNAIKTTIPAYEEGNDGNPTHYYTIREVLCKVISELGGIKKFIVDDIGEYYGTEANPDYMQYRSLHPGWNCLPYDLEYSVGANVAEILSDIVELYPDNDCAFDESGVLRIGMIPSCTEDDVILENEEIQALVIDESCSTDISSVRNVVHVWGQTFEPDYFADDCVNTNNTYTVTIDSYDEYVNGDLIGITIPASNASVQFININQLGAYPIYDTATNTNLGENTLSGGTYVFQYEKQRFYLQGQWQAHALSVLVDGSVSKETWQCKDGTRVPKYSKKYFQEKYAVQSVDLKIIPDSPFTVQKIGERLSVKSGDVYDNITSDALALLRSDYELKKSARLTDNITITLSALLPWVKEYMKISYKKMNEPETKQYLTDSVTLNFSDGTTSITMHTFYPLYE